jgi:hypothetical protein
MQRGRVMTEKSTENRKISTKDANIRMSKQEL